MLPVRLACERIDIGCLVWGGLPRTFAVIVLYLLRGGPFICHAAVNKTAFPLYQPPQMINVCPLPDSLGTDMKRPGKPEPSS